MVLEFSVKEVESGERLKINVDPEDKVADTLGRLKEYWGLKGDRGLFLDGDRLKNDLFWAETPVESGALLSLHTLRDGRELPEDIWRGRIENELKSIKEAGYLFEIHEEEGCYRIEFDLEDTPAPIEHEDSIALAFEHKFSISVPRSYPYRPPSIRWESPIYHPNIEPPSEGGKVGLRYLNKWDFSKSLGDVVERVKDILLSPDEESVLESEVCRRALKSYEKGDFPSLY